MNAFNLKALALRHVVLSFLALTWTISLVPFVVVVALDINPFADVQWLPLLLPMVWGPTLAAGVLWRLEGTLRTNLKAFLRRATLFAWLGALSPLVFLVVAVVLRPPVESVPPLLWALMVAMNLILGPLGEEAGWRGFLLPRLVPTLGALRAALVVGVIWAVWHLPLWFIDSPQAAIPFGVFAATTLCFSVVLTALWRAAPQALGPCVLFHLVVNVVANALEVMGVVSAADGFVWLLPGYVALALGAAWTLRQTPA